MDGSALKWKYHDPFASISPEEVDKLSAEESKALEEKAMEQNAWHVARDVQSRIDDEPGPAGDFMKAFITGKRGTRSTCKVIRRRLIDVILGQRIDNAIHQINHHTVDSIHVVCFVSNYPLYSGIYSVVNSFIRSISVLTFVCRSVSISSTIQSIWPGFQHVLNQKSQVYLINIYLHL